MRLDKYSNKGGKGLVPGPLTYAQMSYLMKMCLGTTQTPCVRGRPRNMSTYLKQFIH